MRALKIVGIGMVIAMGVLVYAASAQFTVTISEWSKYQPLIIEKADTDTAEVIDAFVAQIMKAVDKVTAESILTGVVTTLGFDKVDLNIAPERTRQMEAMRKLADLIFTDPDAAIAAAKAASELKPVPGSDLVSTP